MPEMDNSDCANDVRPPSVLHTNGRAVLNVRTVFFVQPCWYYQSEWILNLGWIVNHPWLMARAGMSLAASG
jgi:hypothetical protein